MITSVLGWADACGLIPVVRIIRVSRERTKFAIG
jgi:hypothetical protein